MKTAYLSEKGVRSSNQDAILLRLEAGTVPLVAVSDGMGGHLAGEVASALALQLLDRQTRSLDNRPPEDMLYRAFETANEEVLTAASEDAGREGMGATLVAALLYEDHFITGNVGDSRLYLYSKGKLRQVTVDHSFVQELVRRGVITQKQALTHPRRNVITRCIGMEDSCKADLFYLHWEKGDRLLLCSDGLCGVLEQGELESILERYGDINKQCQALYKAAMRQGSRDNISILLVEHDGEGF